MIDEKVKALLADAGIDIDEEKARIRSEMEEDEKCFGAKSCVICGRLVDWDIVKEEFAETLEQADCYGVDSLTEAQQVVYERSCCSTICYAYVEMLS